MMTGMHMDDEAFLRGLVERDNEAYKVLYREFYRPLVLFGQRYVGDEETARDVVQETFVALLEEERLFESVFHLKFWLYSSTRNRCLNHERHERVKAEALAEMARDEEAMFEVAAVEEDVYSMLIRAIERLAPRSREVMELTLEGLSNQEIATRMGATLETVKSYKKAAKKRLAEMLGKELWAVVMAVPGLWEWIGR